MKWILLVLLLISCSKDEDMRLFQSSLSSEAGVTPPPAIPDDTSLFKLVLNGAAGTYIESVYDGEILTQYINPFKTSNNRLFEFETGSLGSDDIFFGGDNNAPLHIDTGAVGGGGHSYVCFRLYATVTKTDADLGSIWTDGIDNYVLLKWREFNYYIFGKIGGESAVMNGLTMNHVSGATDTSAIVGTSTTYEQLFPIWSYNTLDLEIDDVPTALVNSEHTASNNMKFIEQYDILTYDSMLQYAIDNVGNLTLGYIFDGQKSFTIKNVITFTRNDMTMKQTLTCITDTNFEDAMNYQGFPIISNGVDTRYLYYPKVIPFSAQGIDWDLANKQDMDAIFPLGDRVNIGLSYWETGLSSDRYLSLHEGIGIVQGYLPLYSATTENRRVLSSDIGMQISASGKQYNHYLDVGPRIMTAGETYAVISYRSLYRSSTDRTSFYYIDDKEGGYYFFMDWHNLPYDDTLTIPTRFIGQPFTLVEKSSNVTYTGSVFSSTLNVSINDSVSYGYLVLKIQT